MQPRLRNVLLLTLALLAVPQSAPGQLTFPQRPGERDLIVDLAKIFNPEQLALLRQKCGKLLTDKATPIIVVTLPDLAKYAQKKTELEEYARALFNHWGIGHAVVDGQPWNKGILVLYLHDTQKVRVELGAGWDHGRDAKVKSILVEQLVPRRQAGDIAGGLIATVKGLDEMAREQAQPEAALQPAADLVAPGGNGQPPHTHNDASHWAIFAFFVILAVVVVAVIRRGRQAGAGTLKRSSESAAVNQHNGWWWWGTNPGGNSGGNDVTGGGFSGGGGDFGGGGFGGGSFGGGSSGGGGASV